MSSAKRTVRASFGSRSGYFVSYPKDEPEIECELSLCASRDEEKSTPTWPTHYKSIAA